MDGHDRVNRLTEKQKEALRLVMQGYGAKEIARIVGVSEHAIVARLKGAMQTLRLSTRFEAARMLAAHESGYQSLIYHPVEVPRRDEFGDVGPSPQIGDEHTDDQPDRSLLRDNADPYLAQSEARFAWPFPTRGRPWNDLTIKQRALWVLVLIAFFALSLGTLVGAMANTTQVLRAVFGQNGPAE